MQNHAYYKFSKYNEIIAFHKLMQNHSTLKTVAKYMHKTVYLL